MLMVVLALATAVMATNSDWARSDSYGLIIRKVFSESTPNEVREQAQKQVYTFRVEAQVKSGGEYSTVEKIVSVTGENEEIVEFGNAFKVSVVEQIDGGGFDIDSDHCVSKHGIEVFGGNH